MPENPAVIGEPVLGSMQVQTLVQGRFCSDGKVIHEKSVDATILASTVAGRYEVSHSGGCWLIGPGETFVVPRLTPVRIVHHPDRRGVMRAKWMHLHITLHGSIDLLGLFDLPPKLTGRQSEPVRHAVDALERLSQRRADPGVAVNPGAGVGAVQPLASLLARQRIACEVAQHLLSLGTLSPRRATMMQQAHRLTSVFQTVAQHLGRPIAVADLVQWAHLSPSRLHAVFLAATGLSPLRYVLQMRLAQARRQLIYTDRPIGQIAADLAFASPFHFSRAFRRGVGMSPRQYRARNTARGEASIQGADFGA